ncbi:MAG TPA: pyridoxal-phosphate dependent enzyme, partial [Solirubrobacteraceae bacterium]
MTAPAGVVRTPLVTGEVAGVTLALKDETAQVTGAFKFRGCSARLASLTAGAAVVTASTGNHGLGLATAARARGCPAAVFVPARTPAVKLDKLRAAGATLHTVEGDFDDADAAAREAARAAGHVYVSSFDDPGVIAGHGSLWVEADEQLAIPPARVYVGVGGGGLLAASLAHWRPRGVEVVGVELESAPAMAASLRAGRAVTLGPLEPGWAEGLAVRRVGRLALEAALRARVRIALVDRPSVSRAMRVLWSEFAIRAEAAGAAALAALLDDAAVG